MPETFTSIILVWCMAKRWRDTTHTFQIADKEMMVNSYNFHQKISLRCDGTLMNLGGALGMQLGIKLLGKRYSTDMIYYYDIETDYRSLPQVTYDDCARMAKAFLLYILGAYLFTNGRQIMSLRLFGNLDPG